MLLIDSRFDILLLLVPVEVYIPPYVCAEFRLASYFIESLGLFDFVLFLAFVSHSLPVPLRFPSVAMKFSYFMLLKIPLAKV